MNTTPERVQMWIVQHSLAARAKGITPSSWLPPRFAERVAEDVAAAVADSERRGFDPQPRLAGYFSVLPPSWVAALIDLPEAEKPVALTREDLHEARRAKLDPAAMLARKRELAAARRPTRK